jgi:HK97 family phage major capsid protein
MDMITAQIGRLEAANGNLDWSAFFMAPRTWKAIKDMKDDEGRFLLQPDPSASFAKRLFGIPVFTSSEISLTETVAGSGAVCSYIILADMDQVVVGRRAEIDLQYSTDVAFASDQTALRATARFDIQPINTLGIDILKGITA